MNPRTFATLDHLKRASWFAAVGANDTDAAIILSSWQEAIEHCSTEEWQNLNLEAANQYGERLRERSIARFDEWNRIVAELKPITIPFVKQKIANIVQQQDLPKEFEDCVQWDILHVCIEAEYADLYPPGYFASQAYWYAKGHFPCGWSGEFPDGMLVIY